MHRSFLFPFWEANSTIRKYIHTYEHTYLVLPIVPSSHVATKVRLLVSRRAHSHPLLGVVHAIARGTDGRLWLMEAGLDESLPSLRGNHGLEFGSGEGVDMACL